MGMMGKVAPRAIHLEGVSFPTSDSSSVIAAAGLLGFLGGEGAWRGIAFSFCFAGEGSGMEIDF